MHALLSARPAAALLGAALGLAAVLLLSACTIPPSRDQQQEPTRVQKQVEAARTVIFGWQVRL